MQNFSTLSQNLEQIHQSITEKNQLLIQDEAAKEIQLFILKTQAMAERFQKEFQENYPESGLSLSFEVAQTNQKKSPFSCTISLSYDNGKHTSIISQTTEQSLINNPETGDLLSFSHNPDIYFEALESHYANIVLTQMKRKINHETAQNLVSMIDTPSKKLKI